MKTALVIGGTGLIGQHLVQKLCARSAYKSVILLNRRASQLQHPKLTERIVDFAALRLQDQADDVFCCLGTTIKAAGSQAAQYEVEVSYPLEVARQALALGAKQFLIVTSTGADPRSRIFYNRMKGEVETQLQALGYDGLHIFRPSLLLGQRNEARAGEQVGTVLAKLLDPFMVGFLARWKAIDAAKVAEAMVVEAIRQPHGIFIHESEVLQQYDSMPMPK